MSLLHTSKHIRISLLNQGRFRSLSITTEKDRYLLFRQEECTDLDIYSY